MQHLHHILKSNIETNVNFKTNLNVSRNLSHIDHSCDMIDHLLNLRLWLCLLRKKKWDGQNLYVHFGSRSRE